jgi:hypothetical protein
MTARAVLLSTAIAALAAPAALAGEPAAQCPRPYILFAVPTDGSRPVAAALDAAGNADGYACELPHSAGEIEHAGSPYNVIDNHVPNVAG